MAQYLFTEQSKQDLIDIRRFTVERWGHKQSSLYLNDVRKTLQLLSDMPSMGKSCFDDLGENMYRFPISSHMVYYLAMQEQIVIVAILHRSMTPETRASTVQVGDDPPLIERLTPEASPRNSLRPSSGLC